MNAKASILSRVLRPAFWGPLGVATLLVTALVVGPGACRGGTFAKAKRVANRDELVGGPRALGEVGDWLLENDRIRVVVQDAGFSRGFGVFGGALIDADLVRPGTGSGTSAAGLGQDNFGELFPAFFLEAMEPRDVQDPNATSPDDALLPAVEVENDGSNGEPAVVTVRGYGNDFLALTQVINENLLGDARNNRTLLFTHRYILDPGASYVKISTTVQNIAINQSPIEWNGAEQLLGAEIPIPFGDVALFGGGNKVFFPHDAGYDLRYRLEDVYASGQYTLPALPGLVGDFIASSSEHVSYGLMAAPVTDPQRSFAMSSGQFTEAHPHSIHIPFIASAFTGVFQAVPPRLEPNDGQAGGDDEFTFTRYFIVGHGDIASISDEVYRLLETPTGQLSGELVEDQTDLPVSGAYVIVEEPQGKKVTTCTTDADGRFRAQLPAGDYVLRVYKKDRQVTGYTALTVVERESTFQRLIMDAPAKVVVNVTEPGRGPIPAKVSLIGLVPAANAGQDTKDVLFDLSVGESWRFTDLVADTEDPDTRRYLETFSHAAHGTATLTARPGQYTVVVSRGPEYALFEQTVVLTAGQTQVVNAEIQHVLPTPGYVSGDFHLHTRFSLDSEVPVDDSLIGYASEGVEFAVSTDHNYVVDFAPTVAALQYENIINTAVGLELTTIDRGHFNAFPLAVQPPRLTPSEDDEGGYTNTIASRTQGSVQWALKTPDEVFDAIREHGTREAADPACLASAGAGYPLGLVGGERGLRDDPLQPEQCQGDLKQVIIQVNHPRDSILGYFEQYGLEQADFDLGLAPSLFAPKTSDHPEFLPEAFSWKFDAMEVFNGKRYELLHTFRVPEGVDIDPLSCCPLTAGEIMRDYPALSCDEEDDMRSCACLPSDTVAQVAAGICTDDKPVAYPGVVEDWMKMLQRGLLIRGTANSDSHDPDKDEAGYPRTYFAVENDEDIRLITNDDMVDAFTKGDLLMTNGPFMQVDVDGVGMGGLVDGSGPKTLSVTVSSAEWMAVSHARVYVGGNIALEEEFAVPEARDGVRTHTFTFDVTTTAADSFVIVEVWGDTNMFPVVFPNEIPPLQFTDVLNAIGGSLGLGGAVGLRPQLTYQVTPFVMSNPIFIDTDGDGEWTPPVAYTPPGDANGQGVGGLSAATVPNVVGTPSAEALVPQRERRRHEEIDARFPKWLEPTRELSDIRRVLHQFTPHAH